MITKAHTVAGNVEIAEAWVLTLPLASEQCCAWFGIVDGVVSLSLSLSLSLSRLKAKRGPAQMSGIFP